MTARALGAAVTVAALLSGACGDSSSPTSPTTVAAGPSTELFSGTLAPGGDAFYSFTVTVAGDVAVTLASTTSGRAAPASTTRLLVALGTPSGFGCATTSQVETSAGLVAQLTNAGMAAGIYCVNVSDPGGITAATAFVVRIVHN